MMRCTAMLMVFVLLASTATYGAQDEVLKEAQRLWNEGKPGDAVRMLEAEHARQPDDPYIAYSLGVWLQWLGASHEAAPLLRQVGKSDDVDIVLAREARYWLALSELALHRRAEAAQVLEEAAKNDTEDSLAPYGLAWVRLEEQRYDEAIESFETAAERGHPAAAADLEYALEQRDVTRAVAAAEGRATVGLWIAVVLGAVAYAGALRKARTA